MKSTMPNYLGIESGPLNLYISSKKDKLKENNKF